MPNLEELAKEYKCQAENLDKYIQKLENEKLTCQGEKLYRINKKLVIARDMQQECITMYYELLHYYDD